jgi:1-deoxy-D-xylulose 5-phosphate reductoisomerase
MHRQVAVKAYLRQFIDFVDVKLSFDKFIKQLYDYRYAPLYSQLQIDNKRGNFKCSSLVENEVFAQVGADMTNFTNAAYDVASIVNKATEDINVKIVFAGDYVEQIVRWAVGPENVVHFMLDCVLNNKT